MLTRRAPLRRARAMIAKAKPGLRAKPLRKSSAKAKKPAAERAFHQTIAAMPCVNCGRWPVHVHHVISDGFARITRNHRLVLPVCPRCHQDGPEAIHGIGTANWNALTGIDQLARARQLWENFEQGRSL